MTTSAEPRAPAELEHVRAFVNTLDMEGGTDEIGTPTALRAWLRDRRLAAATTATEVDVERAQRLREALRALLRANHGYTLDPSALRTLNALASGLPLALAFEDGAAQLKPTVKGIDGGLASLLAAVFRAQADGTWKRMKACGSDTCQWAFYDHSKNLSRAWCSMAVCGNRTKVRAYQRRQREKEQP